MPTDPGTPTRPPAPSPSAPAPAPVLAVAPAAVQEYCANGDWPGPLTVRNTGGGSLHWQVGSLPAGLTVTPSGGTLAANGSQQVALGGRVAPPFPQQFVVRFSGDGGDVGVTVDCA